MDEDTLRRFYEPETQEELFSSLKVVYEKGYRYIVKEPNEIYLTAYESEPEYNSYGYWGYSDRDLLKKKNLIAYPLKTNLLSEVHKPRLISDVLWPRQTIEEPEVKDQLSLF